MNDNISYSTIERSEDGSGSEIIRYNVKKDTREIIVPAEWLIPAEGYNLTQDYKEGQPIPISNYIWSADGKKLLIFTNTARVWRDHTRGDYWVLDLETKKLQQLGQGMRPERLMFAKFSPDATKVAYVYFNNIYVEDLGDSKIKQLTFDGSDIIINGNFDWVYEEELGIQDGFRWSPDSEKIAYWHSDTEGTGTFYMINNIDSIYSQPIPLPYPKVGTTNSAVKVGVVDIETAESKWFDIPGDPRNNYLARMDFIPNSDEVIIQQLNRLQNTNRVYKGNVRTMSLDQFYTDKEETFLNVYDEMRWLDDEEYFTWMSEKDGWRHLYKVSRDGKSETLITKGDFDVISLLLVDTRGGYAYYLASPESAVEKYLYRSPLDGSSEAERLTPMSAPDGLNTYVGHHSYHLSPDARFAVHTFNNNSTPNFYQLIELKRHKTIKVMQDNAELKARYNSLNLNPKEYFKVDIGHVELDGWMIKPSGFDPSKKYPVIYYIYGEPASSTVQDSWSSRDMWNQFLAQQGYIVMSVDPRGTNNPRGREWRKSIYGKIGIVSANDHAQAVEEINKTFSFVDSNRIGIWGWSGGGSSTLNAMFKYPDLYHTGIAVAFVSLQNLYDTIYQERYMGLPSTNPDGFKDGSPINHVAGLKGNLMLIHGTGDDNVHYQSLEMLTDELIKQNKIFSMMSYPMRSHGIYERENTTYHLYRTMLKYWLENLPSGGR